MAAYWQIALPLARVTTSDAAQSHPFYRGRRHGTSSYQYRCRSRQSRSWTSEASKCSSILTPPGQLQSLAGQEHGRTIPLAEMEPTLTERSHFSCQGISFLARKATSYVVL